MIKYKQINRFLISSIIFTMAFILKSNIVKAEIYSVSPETISDLQKQVDSLLPGDKLLLNNGEYKDLKLIINNSGEMDNPIVIEAVDKGNVIFSGDSKVEIRGNYIELNGIYFRDGARKAKEWKTHGPGLISIYGDYNRITNIAIHNFDNVDSAWITTELDSQGHVPKYNRIDHCSFTGKTTRDQVINLNNSKDKNGMGEAQYNRIDHCYFSNPKKKGNSGGAIRIGYYRNDIGRCLVDNNLFENQDSEAEIITSKSQENIYLNNTIKNSQGTLNFRHGDNQVAIGNYFIGTNSKKEAGGMFIWGSGHIIANNYFSLKKTITSRGNAAIYLNPGEPESEHALAYNNIIANNIFFDNQEYCISLDALYTRRINENSLTENTKENKFINNIFISDGNTKLAFDNQFKEIERQDVLENNVYCNLKNGYDNNETINTSNLKYRIKNNICIIDRNSIPNYNEVEFFVKEIDGIENIQGLENGLNLNELAHKSIYENKPLDFNQVGPEWLLSIPN